jgi:hypothetical protein
MFSSKEYLDKKTGEFGVGRREFLGQLVNEFHESNSLGKYLNLNLNLPQMELQFLPFLP